MTRKRPLRSTITSNSQRYLDRPVYRTVSAAVPLALAIHTGYATEAGVPGWRIQPVIEEFSHYERVQLRWMVPDGNGGLKPKYPEREAASSGTLH